MGLDCTHDCWHGPYSSFGIWRRHLASVIGIRLGDMEGFGGMTRWPGTDPLEILLNHSDCDGEIAWKDTTPLADRLEEILPRLDSSPDWDVGFSDRGRAKTFIEGLRAAAASKESVGFH